MLPPAGARAGLVPALAPPPEAIPAAPREELQNLDGVAGELDFHRLQPGVPGGIDEGLRLVSAQVAEPTVVARFAPRKASGMFRRSCGTVTHARPPAL